MMRSLYSAVSGLKTHQTKMDVIGNNIANVNTVAFKATSVNFYDVMYQTTQSASGSNALTGTGGTNAKQIGLGVSTASMKVAITSEGAAQSTGEALDIKLSGDSFYIAYNGTNNVYTRDGSFYIDGEGNLCMASTGYNIMGWDVSLDAEGNRTIDSNSLKALRVMSADNSSSSPVATSKATVAGILDKNTSTIASSSGYTMSVTTYDNKGYSYTVKLSVVENTNTPDADNDYYVCLNDVLDADGNSVLPTKEKYVADYLEKNGIVTDPSDPAYNATAYTTAVTTATTEYYAKMGSLWGENASGMSTIAGNTLDPFAPGSKIGETGYSVNASGDIIKDSDGSTLVAAGATPSADDLAKLGYVNGTKDGVYTVNYSATVDATNGLVITQTKSAYAYQLTFNKDTGVFEKVGASTTGQVSLNLGTAIGGEFSDITIDFNSVKNYDNSGTSTMGITRGITEGGSVNGTGRVTGSLTGISVQTNGMIYGSYDNGDTVLLGQIAVAAFANASGLEANGNNTYSTTLNSGDPTVQDVTADGGSMSTGQLEMSNVDLSTQFTDMITTQRGFQANSRVITTSDTMLEELINLKR